jgi:ADP-dependent NAD(P)H-hydrate dehydratase / NAD(P)H-hydrate epimerase
MPQPTSYPVLSTKQVLELEKKLLGRDPKKVRQAMEAVAKAFVNAVLQDFQEISPLFPENARILILLGKGHNAGDGLYAIKHILERYPKACVDIIFAFGKDNLKPLVQELWQSLAPHPNITVLAPDLHHLPAILDALNSKPLWHLCIDAIHGFSFSPPLAKQTAALLKTINALDTILLRAALDLPSGLTEEATPLAFRADFTYLAGSPKLQACQPLNAPWVGRIRLLDIMFFHTGYTGVSKTHLLSKAILNPLRHLRKPQSYKKDYGHLLLIAGSRAMPGALLMSAKAALKGGIGLLSIACPESLVGALAAALPEAMWLGLPETPTGFLSKQSLGALKAYLPKVNTLLIGPGLGQDPSTVELLQGLILHSKQALVLDADALNAATLKTLKTRTSTAPVYLTPHIGELRRLLSLEKQELTSSKIAKNPQATEDALKLLKSLAKQSKAYALLKGSLSYMTDGRALFISPFGGPILARGGSGDILSGLLAAIVAQREGHSIEPLLQAAVWHGLAADTMAQTLGQRAVQTTDLLHFLTQALRTLS